ncbi:MAG: hypothetical protein PVJ50_07440 [Desulfobacterales bacterium]|jgi:hypothetical protein
MKKKSLIILITVTLVIVAFGIFGPASAKKPFDVRAMFEADIVPVDSQPLEKGEVWIRESGDFKVEIEGAEFEEDYVVYLMFGSPGTPTDLYLGDLSTDEEGEGKLEGSGLCFLLGGYAGNPWIEIRFDDETVQYVSGFELEACSDPSVPPGL